MPCVTYEDPVELEHNRYLRETREIFEDLVHDMDRVMTAKQSRTKDCTQALCALIKGMTEEELNKFVYDGRSPTARRLANWWDDHQEKDAANKLAQMRVIIENIKKDIRREVISQIDRAMAGMNEVGLKALLKTVKEEGIVHYGQ